MSKAKEVEFVFSKEKAKELAEARAAQLRDEGYSVFLEETVRGLWVVRGYLKRSKVER